eukprot:Filipodium_phascolosomae@DN2718_c0_g1_i20.p1
MMRNFSFAIICLLLAISAVYCHEGSIIGTVFAERNLQNRIGNSNVGIVGGGAQRGHYGEYDRTNTLNDIDNSNVGVVGNIGPGGNLGIGNVGGAGGVGQQVGDSQQNFQQIQNRHLSPWPARDNTLNDIDNSNVGVVGNIGGSVGIGNVGGAGGVGQQFGDSQQNFQQIQNRHLQLRGGYFGSTNTLNDIDNSNVGLVGNVGPGGNLGIGNVGGAGGVGQQFGDSQQNFEQIQNRHLSPWPARDNTLNDIDNSNVGVVGNIG